MAKNTLPVLSTTERESALTFLQHVAESEHHLRHHGVFSKVVAALGFELGHDGVRYVVADPQQDQTK
jgi:hypothetical protein